MVCGAKPDARLGSLGSVCYPTAQQPQQPLLASPLPASSPQQALAVAGQLSRMLAEALDDFDKPAGSSTSSCVRGARGVDTSASPHTRLNASPPHRQSIAALRSGAQRLRSRARQSQCSPQDSSSRRCSLQLNDSQPQPQPQPVPFTTTAPLHNSTATANPTVRPTDQPMQATHPSVPAVSASVRAVGPPPSAKGAREPLAAVQAIADMVAPEMTPVGRHSQQRPSTRGDQVDATRSLSSGWQVPHVQGQKSAPMEHAHGSSNGCARSQTASSPTSIITTHSSRISGSQPDGTQLEGTLDTASGAQLSSSQLDSSQLGSWELASTQRDNSQLDRLQSQLHRSQSAGSPLDTLQLNSSQCQTASSSPKTCPTVRSTEQSMPAAHPSSLSAGRASCIALRQHRRHRHHAPAPRASHASIA